MPTKKKKTTKKQSQAQLREPVPQQEPEAANVNLSMTGVPMKQLIPQAWALYGQLVGKGFIPAPDLDLSGEDSENAVYELHQQIMQLTMILERIDQQSLY